MIWCSFMEFYYGEVSIIKKEGDLFEGKFLIKIMICFLILCCLDVVNISVFRKFFLLFFVFGIYGV